MGYRARKQTLLSEGLPMKMWVLQPDTPAPAGGRPGVLWIHGGGYITGMPEMVFFTRARSLAQRHGAVVISPEYRLAGKAPYPAALQDCHNALVYLRDHAQELGVRSDQLMVGGESAGGGLAAALCLYEKDTDGVRIAFQMPLYPMLDDRDTESSRSNHAPVWNTRRNHFAWRKYLKGLPAQAVPAYAAAARRTEHAGLPPAYTFVSTAEPFYAETLAYIHSLQQAGVEASVDVYPGLFHAFDMLMPFWRVSKKAAAAFEARFEYAVRHYFAAQPGP